MVIYLDSHGAQTYGRMVAPNQHQAVAYSNGVVIPIGTEGEIYSFVNTSELALSGVITDSVGIPGAVTLTNVNLSSPGFKQQTLDGSGNVVVDLNLGHYVVIENHSANIQLDIINFTAGDKHQVTVEVIHDGTSNSYDITYPSNFSPSGTAFPTFTAQPNAVDKYSITGDGDQKWYTSKARNNFLQFNTATVVTVLAEPAPTQAPPSAEQGALVIASATPGDLAVSHLKFESDVLTGECQIGNAKFQTVTYEDQDIIIAGNFIIDLSQGLFIHADWTGNATLSLINLTAEFVKPIVILLSHDGTVNTYTLEFDFPVKSENQLVPSYTQSASAVDLLVFTPTKDFGVYGLSVYNNLVVA